MLIDSLIVIGIATTSLGTIHEENGVQERTFWLKNIGQTTVQLRQGYTSCGCTTIHFDRNAAIAPGDSSAVTLRFNPRGKGGEFHEMGTIEYGEQRKRVNMAMVGECITSEETLLKQFPIRINDRLRMSVDRYDLGIVRVGTAKERHVAVLHWNEANPNGDRRIESIKIDFAPTEDSPKGLQHIPYPIKVNDNGEKIEINVILDVIVR